MNIDKTLDFPHQDDNYWLEIEAGGHKAYQYPSPFEVKMLIIKAIITEYKSLRWELVENIITSPDDSEEIVNATLKDQIAKIDQKIINLESKI